MESIKCSSGRKYQKINQEIPIMYVFSHTCNNFCQSGKKILKYQCLTHINKLRPVPFPFHPGIQSIRYLKIAWMKFHLLKCFTTIQLKNSMAEYAFIHNIYTDILPCTLIIYGFEFRIYIFLYFGSYLCLVSFI